MGKKDKKAKASKNVSKKESPQSPQSTRNNVVYDAVPGSDTENPNASGGSGPPSPKHSKRSKKGKKGKKDKRNDDTDDNDDESIVLQRKPSPVVAPLPQLTKQEYKFFEMVRTGDVDDVANFLKKKFSGMDINKTNKSGYTVLHYAVRRQDEDMVRLLLKQPGIKLHDTIMYAVKEENVEITKILLEQYDQLLIEEQNQFLMSSTMGADMSRMVSTTMGILAPQMSPISARSGMRTTVKIKPSSIRTDLASRIKVKKSKSRSKSNIPSSSVLHTDEIEYDNDDDEEDFVSEFPPGVSPLMLAAQQGSLPLMELFYARTDRLESAEFPHDTDCGCETCSKVNSDQDLTKEYERYQLYKALSNPEYICFIARMEHKDPINYALHKILRVREIIDDHQSFSKLFDGIEEELEEFITKMIQLCRNTVEAEIFLSPKDSDERLPHLHPRLWYTVGLKLKNFVAAPNTQNIVYQIWATDGWPKWDTYTTFKRFSICAAQVAAAPLIAITLFFLENTQIGRVLSTPLSRFLTYIGMYVYFMIVVGIQALYPNQRCNDEPPYYQLDDGHCKQRGPPKVGTEVFLILFVLGFYVSIAKRRTVTWFWRMRWNWIEVVGQLCFTITIFCWLRAWLWTQESENQELLRATERILWPHNCAEIVGECFLAVSFLITFIRLLRFIVVIPEYGHIQIGFGYQVVDFVKSMVILSVVVLAFGSGLMGLLIPYKDFRGVDTDFHEGESGLKEIPQYDGFHSVKGTFLTLFWAMNEHSNDDNTKLLTWRSRNGTDENEDIHHDYTEWTAKGLSLGFNFIGCMMLGTMLAGYFSQTMTQIEEDLDMHWKYARTELYLTFVKDTVLPPPFNLFPTVNTVLNSCKWLTRLGRKDDPITGNKKREKWHNLSKGYRKLILQLIYRYLNYRKEELGEQIATKDDVLEMEEEIAEIKAVLKKAIKKRKAEIKGRRNDTGLEQSGDDDHHTGDDTDDSDDDKPSPGGGSGAVSGKSGWTKTKYMLESSGATYLKNIERSGAVSRTAGASSQMNANSAPVVTHQPSRSKIKPGASSSRQEFMTAATKPTPKREPGVRDNTGFPETPQKNNTAPFSANSQMFSQNGTRYVYNTPPNQSTDNYKIPRKGSRSGGGLEHEAGIEDNSGFGGQGLGESDDVEDHRSPEGMRTPQRKEEFIAAATLPTPKRGLGIRDNTGLSETPQKNNTAPFNMSSQMFSQNGTRYSTPPQQSIENFKIPRKGSRSGGGLEREAGLEDNSGANAGASRTTGVGPEINANSAPIVQHQPSRSKNEAPPFPSAALSENSGAISTSSREHLNNLYYK